MDRTTFTWYSIATILLTSFFLFVFNFHGALGSSSYVAYTSAPIVSEQRVEVVPISTPVSTPLRLKISSIKVDAKVQQVGLTAKQAMGIPTNFKDVGWYKYGTLPGEVGSAVIDGHVDNALGLAGVFKHLDEVKVGEEVIVQDINGTDIHFIVTSIDRYDYKTTPPDIFNEKNKSLLRLITCEGKWISKEKTYDKRLVVTAELRS